MKEQPRLDGAVAKPSHVKDLSGRVCYIDRMSDIGAIFKDPDGVAECTYDDILAVVKRLWPLLYTKKHDNDYIPIVDGHWRVGFSLRLFGPGGTASPERRAAAWAAIDQLQCALEDLGFETTRDGNAWQDGRLVLGWATTAHGKRIVDLPEEHPARTERRERLTLERAARAVESARTN